MHRLLKSVRPLGVAVLAIGLTAGVSAAAQPPAARTAPTAQAARATSGFVQRSGTNLTLNGKQFRFVGDNNYQLTSDRTSDKCGQVLSTNQVNAVLSQAKAAGATVVRTWFFQNYYAKAGYAPFDRVLKAAAAKNLKVVPVLVNYQDDCESSQYKARKDEHFFDTGYKSAGYGYKRSFRDYATAVAAHYKNNKTVAFWQLVNEAETTYLKSGSPTCNTDIQSDGHSRSSGVLHDFAATMGQALHHADPNHLVSLGTIGSGQCGAGNSTEYRYVYSAPGIDICEYHDYGHNADASPGDQYNGLAVRIADCNSVHKPMLIGEAGIAANVQPNGKASGKVTQKTLQQRAKFFSAKLDYAFSHGVDGYLLWQKVLGSSSGYGIGPNDPLNAVTAKKAKSL